MTGSSLEFTGGWIHALPACLAAWKQNQPFRESVVGHIGDREGVVVVAGCLRDGVGLQCGGRNSQLDLVNALAAVLPRGHQVLDEEGALSRIVDGKAVLH